MSKTSKKKPAPLFVSTIRDIGFDFYYSIDYWRHNLFGLKQEKIFFSKNSLHHPILLLHGFMGTPAVLKPLEDFLRSKNRDVLTLDLGLFNVRDIVHSAQILSFRIERIMEKFCEAHEFEKIDIIGHSMGGLVGLYYIKKLGGHRVVDRLITLG